jgi:hypothetical protein
MYYCDEFRVASDGCQGQLQDNHQMRTLCKTTHWPSKGSCSYPDVAQSPRIMYPGGARGRQIATCWEGFSPAEIATTPHLKCRIRTQIISTKDMQPLTIFLPDLWWSGIYNHWKETDVQLKLLIVNKRDTCLIHTHYNLDTRWAYGIVLHEEHMWC